MICRCMRTGGVRRSTLLSRPGEVPQRSARTRAELHGDPPGRKTAETASQVYRHSYRSTAEWTGHQRGRLSVCIA